MQSNAAESKAEVQSDAGKNTVFKVLLAISFCHFLNDTVQSLIPAIYPMLKASFHLTFAQLGLITLTYQLTASLLQPFVGHYTDTRPKPYFLPAGMASTLVGLVLLSIANRYAMLLAAGALVGMGSAIFHPESSRVARVASGGQHGLAQSVFQVGGNAGTAMGPLLAALIVLPRGRSSIAWFSVGSLLGIIVLRNVSAWYKKNGLRSIDSRPSISEEHRAPVRKRVGIAIAILVALVFSKYFYLASLTSYYTFYLMHQFHVSVRHAQLHLFLFLGAAAVGTLVGGPVGDRIGRKHVIWGSIVGVLPFTLALPYANLFWTGVLTVFIGLIIASAFPAILVYAQELVVGRLGMISGVFFGLAFGLGGIGAAVLGQLADHTSIDFVYRVCSFLPLIGVLTWFLPEPGEE